MPQVRILVSYPGDPHPSGSVIELEAHEASQLVTEGRAEYIRENPVETAMTGPSERAVKRNGRSRGQ